MTLGSCPVSIFCSGGTPPDENLLSQPNLSLSPVESQHRSGMAGVRLGPAHTRTPANPPALTKRSISRPGKSCLPRSWDAQGLSIYSTRSVPSVNYSNFANQSVWSGANVSFHGLRFMVYTEGLWYGLGFRV